MFDDAPHPQLPVATRPVGETIVVVVHRPPEKTADPQPAIVRRPFPPSAPSPDVIEDCPLELAHSQPSEEAEAAARVLVAHSQPPASTNTRAGKKLKAVRYSHKRSLARSAAARSELKLRRTELLKERKAFRESVAWKDELAPEVVVFLEEKISVGSKKKRGHRWSAETKAFALAIYFKSPAALKVARRLLSLPSRTTLLKPLRHILEKVTKHMLYFY